ncbi:MAG: efflux RND transporter periplasmic adaptor subunit [Polyangiaceae bacterium]
MLSAALSRALPFAVCCLLSACEQVKAEESSPAYPVAAPNRAPEFHEREYVGEVRAAQHVEIRARIAGPIEAAAVDEGQPAKKGQLLFSIGARGYQQELLKAQALTKSAAAELGALVLEHENAERLQGKNIVSGTEVALLAAKVAALRAKLEEAKATQAQAALNVSYGAVRAPFDGAVDRIPKKTGSLVADGDLLTTLSNADEVFVYFNVSEQDYLRYLKSGEQAKQVHFKTATGELHPSQGVVDAIRNEVDKQTGTLSFRARFPNAAAVLRHGSTGQVVLRFALGEALAVPQKSTFEVQDQLYVYVVDQEDRARARKVVPALRLQDAFVLQSGLNAGDRLLVEGAQKVKDGQKIQVRAAPTQVGSAQ